MIRYALQCRTCEAEFDAWFASAAGFDAEAAAGRIACPGCRSCEVGKQIMAPAVKPARSAAKRAAEAFARQARAYIADHYDHVGDAFADEARAMHYGEIEQRPIWGATTLEEAEALREEGVPAAPLPAPFAPTPPRDKSEMN